MQPLQRAALRSARQLRPQVQKLTLRHGSSSHGSNNHSGPTTESFGPGFYVFLALIPTAFAVWKVTGPDSDGQPHFTRVFNGKFEEYKQQWEERNSSHTDAMERAAADRVLFLNETTQDNHRHINLRYPEIVNASSPWNVPAGRGSANIDALIAKYEKEAYAQDKKQLEQLREGKVPVEQPFESFRKVTPAAADS